MHHLIAITEKSHEYSFSDSCASGPRIESETSQTVKINTRYFDIINVGTTTYIYFITLR